MREIGEEFVRLRKESRAGAWSSLQERLMKNLGLLVPEATSMKDFFGLAMAIEEFLKTEQGSESMHPMEALERFLNAPTPTDDSDDSGPEGLVQ